MIRSPAASAKGPRETRCCKPQVRSGRALVVTLMQSGNVCALMVASWHADVYSRCSTAIMFINTCSSSAAWQLGLLLHESPPWW